MRTETSSPSGLGSRFEQHGTNTAAASASTMAPTRRAPRARLRSSTLTSWDRPWKRSCNSLDNASRCVNVRHDQPLRNSREAPDRSRFYQSRRAFLRCEIRARNVIESLDRVRGTPARTSASQTSGRSRRASGIEATCQRSTSHFHRGPRRRYPCRRACRTRRSSRKVAHRASASASARAACGLCATSMHDGRSPGHT